MRSHLQQRRKMVTLHQFKQKALKISSLLAQYLYAHQQLSLPGIGRFILNSAEPVIPETGRNAKQGIQQSVEFIADSTIKEVPELISFIASQTGKIKALAAADLESFLELGNQFLNIGKPFVLEGIGSLEKKQSGELEFSSGPSSPVMIRESVVKESPVAGTEEDIPDYKSVFYQAKKTKANWKKPAAILLMLAGLVLAIWGGYTVYKRTTARNSKATEEKVNPETVPVSETTAVTETAVSEKAPVPDTAGKTQTAPSLVVAPAASAPAGTFKFVIETAARERALSRYARLKAFGLDIKMETRDSARFNIYFLLPASPADTARMVDSLRVIYTPAGNRAFVEN